MFALKDIGGMASQKEKQWRCCAADNTDATHTKSQRAKDAKGTPHRETIFRSPLLILIIAIMKVASAISAAQICIRLPCRLPRAHF
jgi:hypothetical protein